MLKRLFLGTWRVRVGHGSFGDLGLVCYVQRKLACKPSGSKQCLGFRVRV